jgi:hypothetical protein
MPQQAALHFFFSIIGGFTGGGSTGLTGSVGTVILCGGGGGGGGAVIGSQPRAVRNLAHEHGGSVVGSVVGFTHEPSHPVPQRLVSRYHRRVLPFIARR